MSEMLRFPPGFLWGAATSAHQTEGQNTNSDWWRSEERGLVPYRSGDASASLHRYREDVELARALGLNAYRLSVEWARIQPEPQRFDSEALAHYRRVLEAVREAGLEPIVTLQHMTLPRWVADQGGWASAETVDHFGVYAGRVAEALGDLARWWVSINEPNVTGLYGYVTGAWPPHLRNHFRQWLRHLRHTVRGHAIARRALRARHGDALVSMAFHINVIQARHPRDPAQQLMRRLGDWLWQGRLLHQAAPILDWVGVNYYYRYVIRWDPRPWRVVTRRRAGYHQPGESYPPGLYEVLLRTGRLGKPVMVTENGVSDAEDHRRGRYLVEHLLQAHRALQAGVDLRGYVYWSLLDNYEWVEGYSRQFGLYAVDFADPAKPRSPRPSASLYGSIARANALDPNLLQELHQAPTESTPRSDLHV